MTKAEALLEANGALSRYHARGYSADLQAYQHHLRVAERGYCSGCDHCCDICNRDGHHCDVCNDVVAHDHDHEHGGTNAEDSEDS